MRITWAYGGRDIPGYEKLIDCYGKREFKSPKRSTVPLLAYWRTADKRVEEFSNRLGFMLSDPIRLNFEHKVPVRRGKGKASCTDLMLTSGAVCVAIEAKFTEREYRESDTVERWLADANKNKDPANRLKVLEGWLGRLCPKLKEKDVAKLPYQLVHRAASACHPKARRRYLVYQVFDLSPAKRASYLSYLQNLRNLLSRKDLSIHLVECGITRKPAQKNLEQRWDKGERDLRKPVKSGLKKDALLDVQIKRVHSV